MIISASIKVDMPAHYGAWFMRRLEAGYCRIARADGFGFPQIPLTREAVEGFVFWTRCVDPFVPVLRRLRLDGFAFTVQFAITGYPPSLDPAPINADAAVAQFARLAREFGPRVAVWRYDPLLVTAFTMLDWHVANFGRLARMLSGATDEVVLAFARYGRWARGACRDTASRVNCKPEEMRDLVKQLARLANRHGIRLTICAQPDLLAPGAAPARCIDAQRLGNGAGQLFAIETAGFTSGCLCARATDIGDCDARSGGYFCGNIPPPRGRFSHDTHGEFLIPVKRRFIRARGEDLPF